MNTQDIDALVRSILQDRVHQRSEPANCPGQCFGADFERVDDAVAACLVAFQALDRDALEVRQHIIHALRKELEPYIVKLSEDAFQETGMGNVPDKIQKNTAALHNTPGTEDLRSDAICGDHGMTLFEYSPYGVIGAITPSTNPTETIINNTISMVAAGNTVMFSPHPGAKNISRWLINKIEEIIFTLTGIHNVVVCVREPTFDSTRQMMAHRDIPLLVVTGGPGIVSMAMKSGKKVIGAGEGNPPVIVDDTADIDEAAEHIIHGASFDYNLPCIAEKACIVVSSVADKLLSSFARHGACILTDPHQQRQLMTAIITADGSVNKALVGKSPAAILTAAGIPFQEEPRLLITEVANDHPLLYIEQLMPVLPLTRVADFNAALTLALKVERGCLHTAMMHSRDVYHLSKAARLMRTSIFVKNAPSYAGIGVGGEGYTTFTIATPTGEGTTSARSFVRTRRCVLNNAFNIK